MKVLLATPSLRKEVGGPAYSVSAIDRFLQGAGVEVATVTQPGQGGVGLSWLRDTDAFHGVDVIHNFGTWTPFNHWVSLRARRRGIPQIFCPMGMLEPWALSQKPLKKRLGWALYQRNDIATSAAVHATAHAEARNLRALGVEAPIAVIPHGVDLPMAQNRRERSDEKTALFLSRIHPKKGLLDLVEAWHRVRPVGWKVVVAGPDAESHQATVEAAVRAKGLGDVFEFVGPVYGEAKTNLFRKADLFVLPTYSENFGLAVAEALAHSVPVITTTEAPWAEMTECRAGWWIPTGADALTSAVSAAVALPFEVLAGMGASGRDLVESRYSWPAVIRNHVRLYEWTLGNGPRPEFLVA